MCKGHDDVVVAPTSSKAFPAASRQRALPRQDAGFVLVFSRCLCQAFLLPYFAIEHNAHIKIPLCQVADFGRAGICMYETCENTAVRMRGSGAPAFSGLVQGFCFSGTFASHAVALCHSHLC